MANPLFNGARSAQMGDMPMNINPQVLQNIGQMIKRGADTKDVFRAFQKSGMTPEVAEQALFMMFPQLKQVKNEMIKMEQSGKTQQDIFGEMAHRANADPNVLTNTYNDLMRLVK